MTHVVLADEEKRCAWCGDDFGPYFIFDTKEFCSLNCLLAYARHRGDVVDMTVKDQDRGRTCAHCGRGFEIGDRAVTYTYTSTLYCDDDCLTDHLAEIGEIL